MKQLLMERSELWKTPNLDGSQVNIDKLSDELFISKENIINSFKTGKVVYLQKSKLEMIKNAEWPKVNSYLELVDFIQKKQKSNPEYERDWRSIRDQLKKNKPIEAPIVMKYKNEYYLLDGNIRLMVSKILEIPPRIYIFYYQG